jgi:hypothetical protein
MEATLNHQVMDERRERREPHACLAWPGRRARAHDMRVNDPPKSGPSPCGFLLPFYFLVAWLLSLKS